MRSMEIQRYRRKSIRELLTLIIQGQIDGKRKTLCGPEKIRRFKFDQNWNYPRVDLVSMPKEEKKSGKKMINVYI